MTFVHLPFSVGSLNILVASLVFMKGCSCCVIRRNFKYSRAVRSCYGKFFEVIGLHDFCYYLHATSPSVTPVICHVLVHRFGSFLLQYMFFGLKVFAFEEQNMMLSANLLLTYILCCDSGLGCD